MATKGTNTQRQRQRRIKKHAEGPQTIEFKQYNKLASLTAMLVRNSAESEIRVKCRAGSVARNNLRFFSRARILMKERKKQKRNPKRAPRGWWPL